ncbi:Procollagen galactosyltransferase 1 [Sphaceloma murrayae]|uniref:Procollagen galactosyltransferase 1 n=1 Tax=Sphaceloma murrayae TaxID=2082308 RepID=A0A2K1QMZ3_9PEZI|nr:Procollagen galactosyltransferase 1 [Sphaceloma murrayae]
MINRRPPRLLRPIFFFTAFFTVFYFVLSSDDKVPNPSTNRLLTFPSQLPEANSTLGFGAIAAVSLPTSPRQQELILAASLTGFQLTIPMQPAWTPADVAALRATRGSTISQGSALAWLGHLNVLRWFLSTNLTSVLILEDDVNWDIHLRTTQVPRVAATTRWLMSGAQGRETADRENAMRDDQADEYWGSTDEWDVLYLGHCGENFVPGKWNFRVQRAGFYDGTLLTKREMHGHTRTLLEAIDLPDRVRVVHRSIRPLCTFGFAVTRLAAARILAEIAPRERDGGTVAYDVRVLEGCRDLGLRCWSTNPELFHHVEGGSEIERADERNETTKEGNKLERGRGKSYEELHKTKEEREAERKQAAGDRVAELMTRVAGGSTLQPRSEGIGRDRRRIYPRNPVVVKRKGVAGVDQPKAANIACGARMSNVDMNDEKTMEYLREKVSRQGLCVRDVEQEMRKEREARAIQEAKTQKKRRKS